MFIFSLISFRISIFNAVIVYRYEKYTTKENESAYAVTGLTTVYEYYAYPNNKRPRISQMLILPPFQNQGLAVHLMNSMYKFYSTDKNVIDITGKHQVPKYRIKDECDYKKNLSFSSSLLHLVIFGYSEAKLPVFIRQL